PVCLALVQLLSPCSAAQFTVVGPPEPILVKVGEDAKLPCKLSPGMSAETMELRWVPRSLRQAVLTYARGQEDTPAAEYQGRTSMLKENITEGKAVLLIREVRASDNGTYRCYFQDGDFSANAEVELQVAALGSEPHVELRGLEAGGIRVGCTSAGWFPRPVIEWRDASGRSLPAEVAPAAADPQGLYEATAFVVLEGRSEQGVSCVFRNPLLGQEKSARVSIAGPYFWDTLPWRICFLLTTSLLGVLLVLLLVLWRRKKQHKAALAEKEAALAEKEAALVEMQQERSAKENLQKQICKSQSRALHLLVSLVAPVTDSSRCSLQGGERPDPNHVMSSLRPTQGERSLKRANSREDRPDTPKRFDRNECVLPCESFMSGSHFREVDPLPESPGLPKSLQLLSGSTVYCRPHRCPAPPRAPISSPPPSPSALKETPRLWKQPARSRLRDAIGWLARRRPILDSERSLELRLWSQEAQSPRSPASRTQ
ncbi:butyrophilin subfamily 3 member A2-like, partial [Pteronotus mesoamericanus]|uniref:butyrophilin subfamily 3 member A2-like n=1 Tax=Pteronotus mesoamericanus TaxID=1884717 RepID=UPI0023EAD97B